MFSADLKINGQLIGHLYGHNKGIEKAPDIYKYYIEYHHIGEGINYVINETILHDRTDGLEKLVINSLRKLS